MAICNELTGDITLNILFAGGKGAGKTANLHYLKNPVAFNMHQVPGTSLSVAEESVPFEGKLERFPLSDFEFLPLHLLHSPLGEQAKLKLVNLFAMPESDSFFAMQSVLLHFTDAVIFVLDSRCERMEENEMALLRFQNQCELVGKRWPAIPTVFQFNHADDPNAFHPESLLCGLRHFHSSTFWQQACAATGRGVYETMVAALECVTGLGKTSRTEFEKFFPSSYLPEFFRSPQA